MNLSSVADFFNNPRTAIIILILFFIAFFLSEGLTTGFKDNFITFGPAKDTHGQPTKFMGISVDSWTKVIIIYIITFMSSLLSTYYNLNAFGNIRAYVWNPSVTHVPYSKFWTYTLLILNPVIQTILTVIQFFATATFQVQYIIPQLLASMLINTPYTLKWLSGKTFL